MRISPYTPLQLTEAGSKLLDNKKQMRNIQDIVSRLYVLTDCEDCPMYKRGFTLSYYDKKIGLNKECNEDLVKWIREGGKNSAGIQ